LVKLSPSSRGLGKNTQVVQITKTDLLKFENDLNLPRYPYAGIVKISNQKGEIRSCVQLNRGDRAVIRREGSKTVYVVDGIGWGRRK